MTVIVREAHDVSDSDDQHCQSIDLLAVARRHADVALSWAQRHGRRDARTYGLLSHGEDYEVWAIDWPVDGYLELHDHGGSAGAFAVLAGSLSETTADADGEWVRRPHDAGGGRTFSENHIHGIVNLGTGRPTSVHVNSPPLERMTFYRLVDGAMVAERTDERAESNWTP